MFTKMFLASAVLLVFSLPNLLIAWAFALKFQGDRKAKSTIFNYILGLGVFCLLAGTLFPMAEQLGAITQAQCGHLVGTKSPCSKMFTSFSNFITDWDVFIFFPVIYAAHWTVLSLARRCGYLTS